MWDERRAPRRPPGLPRVGSLGCKLTSFLSPWRPTLAHGGSGRTKVPSGSGILSLKCPGLFPLPSPAYGAGVIGPVPGRGWRLGPTMSVKGGSPGPTRTCGLWGSSCGGGGVRRGCIPDPGRAQRPGLWGGDCGWGLSRIPEGDGSAVMESGACGESSEAKREGLRTKE